MLYTSREAADRIGISIGVLYGWRKRGRVHAMNRDGRLYFDQAEIDAAAERYRKEKIEGYSVEDAAARLAIPADAAAELAEDGTVPMSAVMGYVDEHAEDFCTAEEAAQIMHVSKACAYKEISSGRLPSVKAGGSHRIARANAEACHEGMACRAVDVARAMGVTKEEFRALTGYDDRMPRKEAEEILAGAGREYPVICKRETPREEGFMNMAETEEALGVKEAKVMSMIRSGELPAEKTRRQWRIPEEAVERKAAELGRQRAVDMSAYMTSTEAAAYLGVNVCTVYAWIRNGKLDSVRHMDHRYILKSDIDAIRDRTRAGAEKA